MPSVATYRCLDCHHVDVPWYMVENAVWLAAGMSLTEGTGYLCFECLERRLGRPLVLGDFMHVRCNYDWPRSRIRQLFGETSDAEFFSHFQGPVVPARSQQTRPSSGHRGEPSDIPF